MVEMRQLIAGPFCGQLLGDFGAREAIVDVPHPRFANLKMQNVFPKFSATPGSIRSIAPQAVGEHNALVFEGLLGLATPAIEALRQAGAI